MFLFIFSFPFLLCMERFSVGLSRKLVVALNSSYSYLNTLLLVFFRSDTFLPFCFVFSGKRRPRTTQSLPSTRHFRRQDMKRVASAPIVVNSYRNQVKAGIVRAMLPRTESSNLRSAFGAAEMWRSKLLTSRPTLERKISSKHS